MSFPSQSSKTDVATLTGNGLIWAVCKAKGLTPVITNTGIAYADKDGSLVYPRYLDETVAVGLVVDDWISVERPSKGQKTPMWRAVGDVKRAPDPRSYQPVEAAHGETYGLAVCRVFVMTRLGGKISIPAELSTAQ